MKLEICENCKYVVRPKGRENPDLICSNKAGQTGEFLYVHEKDTCRNCQPDRNRVSQILPQPPEGNIKYIPLTKGQYAIVDAEDYEQLNKHKWCAVREDKNWYACRWKEGRILLMHRVIINAPNDMLVDHIDNNSLNNRRSNLRLCNSAQNAQNRRPVFPKRSKYKGVNKRKGRKKWRVLIRTNNQPYNVGSFDDEIEAAKAYDKKAAELFGEFAYLNFPKLK